MKEMALMGFSVYFISCSLNAPRRVTSGNRTKKTVIQIKKLETITRHLMAAKAKAF
ncbi:hypothetical protein [Rurimicrobium arvi]|uniref:hypothetical protein n=1 Tax=Rurimicrobium arvi TaxID=2049916 RepID=UPI0031D4349F